jgi:hypothetical protein
VHLHEPNNKLWHLGEYGQRKPASTSSVGARLRSSDNQSGPYNLRMCIMDRVSLAKGCLHLVCVAVIYIVRDMLSYICHSFEI